MTKKKQGLVLMTVGALIIILASVYYFTQSPSETPLAPDITSETINLLVFIQNKEVAATSDCSATMQVSYEVPVTDDIADFSLSLLFMEELSVYGVYDSVTINGNTARVFLQESTTPDGRPLSSLSSCEIGHLTSVINDTLTQYGEIEFVEIYTPEGKLEF